MTLPERDQVTRCGRFQPHPFWDPETLEGGGCARVMSAANSGLKEECGNGESFDHLSVTRERRGETGVCVLSCAGWVGAGLAREAAFRRDAHGKPGAPVLLISKGF